MASDWTMKAHDRLPSIRATFTTAGAAVDLTSATSVNFIMKSKSGNSAAKVNAAATIVDAVSGIVRYDWAIGDTDTPGDYQAEWQVTWSSGQQQTFPTLTYHSISILADLDNA